MATFIMVLLITGVVVAVGSNLLGEYRSWYRESAWKASDDDYLASRSITELDRLINDPRHSLLEVVEEAERQAVLHFHPENVNQY